MVMTTDWRCDSCHQTVESGQIRSILKDLEIQTRGLNKDDIPSLKSLLKKYSGALHRNHTLVTEVKQLLVSGLGRSAGHSLDELSDADLRLKMMCCQQLLSLLDIVSPGLSLGKICEL